VAAKKRRPHLSGHGTARSNGIVIGRVQKLAPGRAPIPEYHISAEQIHEQQLRLEHAVQEALNELDSEQQHLASVHNQDPLLILEAHRLLMLDPELVDNAVRLIHRDHINAEWALRRQIDHIGAIFDRIDDEYLRSKKSDIEQVGTRILRQMMGESLRMTLSGNPEKQILLAEDFSPLEVVSMWRIGVSGLVSTQGGTNAHALIVARGIGLPALGGTSELYEQAEDDDLLILDAEQGQWILNPTDAELEQYRSFQAAIDVVRNNLQQFAELPSLSRDGRPMRIMANLEFPDELEMAMELGAEGIGLYRTEFLFMQDNELPDEESQYQHYAQVVRRMQGRTVTFRLLDVGSDKPLFQNLSGRRYSGQNPAMGLRGIRLLLSWPDVLKAQIRAILRAAELGPVRLLVPMVSTVEEMEQVRELVDLYCRELGISERIPVGAMIEVPAAALIAEELAAVSDLFSIGTNDLIQYTLASDRADDEVNAIYRPDHPAVLQLIVHTVKAARQTAIPVSVCGELAANPDWTQIFLNLGMESLSMSLNNILIIRKHLSRLVYQPKAIPGIRSTLLS